MCEYISLLGKEKDIDTWDSLFWYLKLYFNIEITSKVSNAPSAPKGTVKTTATSDEDKEIEAMLAQLKAWKKDDCDFIMNSKCISKITFKIKKLRSVK